MRDLEALVLSFRSGTGVTVTGRTLLFPDQVCSHAGVHQAGRTRTVLGGALRQCCELR